MKNIIKIIIGFFIIFLLLYNVGFTNYLNVLSKINLGWFLLALILSIFMQFFATYNILILIKALNKEVPFLNLIRYTSLSWALGNISPGRLGEFGLVWLFKNRENIEYGEGLAIAIVDKILTLFALLTISAIGFYIFLGVKIFIIFILITFLLLIFILILIWEDTIKNFIKKYILKSYSKYFIGFSQSLKYLLRKKKKYLIFNLILTYIKWGINFLSIYFLFLAFNFPFPFYLIIIFFSFIIIISLIPILGLKELSIIPGTYLLILSNVPPVIGANVIITSVFQGYLLSFIYYIINQSLLQKLEKL